MIHAYTILYYTDIEIYHIFFFCISCYLLGVSYIGLARQLFSLHHFARMGISDIVISYYSKISSDT